MNNDFVFKEIGGKLEYVGDFDSLYKNVDDPWYQSCQTDEPIKHYYKFSRDRLITQLTNINPKSVALQKATGLNDKDSKASICSAVLDNIISLSDCNF